VPALQAIERGRARVAASLRGKRAEIEEAALARAHSISDPADIADPAYTEGLRRAVAAAVDYGIAAVELGDEAEPPVPSVLLGQARLAAYCGVSLDTVLRRYVAGFNLFGNYLLRESEVEEPDASASRWLLQAHAAQFDRLLAAISEEYARARESRLRSPQQRQAARVSRLLAGESPEAVGLDYRFEGWHLGAIAVGREVASALGHCARSLSRHVLRVSPEDGVEWLWLRAEDRHVLDPFEACVRGDPPTTGRIAIGEPAKGMAGWRLTHRQAAAAMSIARLDRQPLVRYCDVALLATALQDDLLAASLSQVYLEPLCTREEGAVLLDTLRAYFRAEQNASSAAPLLAVSRQTVANRIRSVEELIGRPLPACSMELQLALRLHDLTSANPSFAK
jgi:hypothetical protein